MANALLDVVDTFLSLDEQYTLLLAACQTQADHDALKARYATAQLNVETCTGEELDADDAEISTLDAQLKVCNLQLKKATSEMGNMSKVLDNLTQAVTIGSKLVAMCV